MRNEEKHKINEEKLMEKKAKDAEDIKELIKLKEKVEKNQEAFKEYDKEVKKYPYSCLL